MLFKYFLLFVIAANISVLSQTENPDKLINLLSHPEHSQGEMAGLITDNSVLLQSRLTLTNQKINNDYIGIEGWARFIIFSAQNSKMIYTKWEKAVAKNDFIIKIPVTDLQAETSYNYQLQYGRDTSEYRVGKLCNFKTLSGGNNSSEISFVVITGMNYTRFYNSPDKKYIGPDRDLGYPAAESVLKLTPDFLIGTGDNVYYDSKFMPIGPAVDEKGMRNYYHLQFSQPRMIDLFSNIASYWEKDDHDYRYNDSDTTGDRAPSHELGIKIFKEQLPVLDPTKKNSVTYGTYRISKELQIWLLEGRDYRSPNDMPDGPSKSIWGPRQKEWLMQTILASDAEFRVLISPTPMIGPDDAYKSDNHVNQKGFRHERDEFFNWLSANDITPNEFFIICGDRHWQYHSVDIKTGYQEFSCGAFVDANARLGRKPGDHESTDPYATEVTQLFTQEEPSGGFLHIEVNPTAKKNQGSKISFNFMDEGGKLLHKVSLVRE